MRHQIETPQLSEQGDLLQETEFLDVVNLDLKWAVASFMSVFIYMVYHTRSFMVASVGMFISLIAYPVAVLLYRVVFQVCPCLAGCCNC